MLASSAAGSLRALRAKLAPGLVSGEFIATLPFEPATFPMSIPLLNTSTYHFRSCCLAGARRKSAQLSVRDTSCKGRQASTEVRGTLAQKLRIQQA